MHFNHVPRYFRVFPQLYVHCAILWTFSDMHPSSGVKSFNLNAPKVLCLISYPAHFCHFKITILWTFFRYVSSGVKSFHLNARMSNFIHSPSYFISKSVSLFYFLRYASSVVQSFDLKDRSFNVQFHTQHKFCNFTIAIFLTFSGTHHQGWSPLFWMRGRFYVYFQSQHKFYHFKIVIFSYGWSARISPQRLLNGIKI